MALKGSPGKNIHPEEGVAAAGFTLQFKHREAPRVAMQSFPFTHEFNLLQINSIYQSRSLHLMNCTGHGGYHQSDQGGDGQFAGQGSVCRLGCSVFRDAALQTLVVTQRLYDFLLLCFYSVRVQPVCPF